MMGRCGFGDVDFDDGGDDVEDGDDDYCDAGGDDDDGHAGVVVQNAIASSEERDNAKRRTDCPLSKTPVLQLLQLLLLLSLLHYHYYYFNYYCYFYFYYWLFSLYNSTVSTTSTMFPASTTLTNCVTLLFPILPLLVFGVPLNCIFLNVKKIISSVSVCAGDNMFEATDLCVGLISVLTVLIFVFVFVIGTCLCFFNSLCAPLCVWHRQCSSGKPSRERNSVYSLLHLVSICRACFNICIPRFFFFYWNFFTPCCTLSPTENLISTFASLDFLSGEFFLVCVTLLSCPRQHLQLH